MENITIDKTIENALNKLGVRDLNQGTSTGSNFFGNGKVLESFSPVDGKLIGKVTSTTKEDFEKVVETTQSGLFIFIDVK